MGHVELKDEIIKKKKKKSPKICGYVRGREEA